jgi:ankyrin repeat protein
MKLATASLALIVVLFIYGCTRSRDVDLINAVHAHDIATVQRLIQRGANPQALAADGWTPLTMAAREGDTQIIALLLRCGAAVDQPEGGGNTALFWASFYDKPSAVKQLLSNGANVNKRSEGGETPLHVALRFKHEEVAEILRKSGGKE